MSSRGEHPVPIPLLNLAYVAEVKRTGWGRDKIVADEESLGRIRQDLGPNCSHVANSCLRLLILACAKNPNTTGEGLPWTDRDINNLRNGQGPRKGYKESGAEIEGFANDYASRLLKRPFWPELRNACKIRDKWRCRICGKSEALEAHHRSYRNVNEEKFTQAELDDLTTLCHYHHQMAHFGILPKE